MQDLSAPDCADKLYEKTGDIDILILNASVQFRKAWQDITDEEIEEWDAEDLDELPIIQDFVEGFEPYSPYDAGWDLHVEFVDPNEDYPY